MINFLKLRAPKALFCGPHGHGPLADIAHMQSTYLRRPLNSVAKSVAKRGFLAAHVLAS